jgi:MGT family glycosyltransferase
VAKFIFINIPSHSHVNPTLPIVQELVARGDQVVYYLTAPFEQAILATGATFRPYESKIEEINQAATSAGKPAGLPMYMPEESSFVLPQILESIRAEQPDCLVYETLCLSGRFAAEILHLPAVTFRMIFAFNTFLANIFRQNAGRDPQVLAAFQASAERLCAQYSLKPFELESIFTHEEALNIVTIPRSFQIDGENFGDHYHFVGSSIAPRHEQVAFPLEALHDQPVLYISHGTVFNNRPDFFNTCFAAFAGTPWTVVLSLGKNVDHTKLDTIPENFIVRPYVPQLEILKHARVCVTHGSMTTIIEAFAQGVPLVVIPQATSDVTVNARRVHQLGLGIHLDEKTLTPQQLQAAVTRVSSDPTFYTRTLQMQQEIQNAGGYTRAADLLQEFAKLHV